MNLTKQQNAALIGMILGDGYLQPTGTRNARLRLEHRLPHKEYLVWKTRLLPPLFQGKPILLQRTHPLTKKIYQYARQQSNASPLIGKLRKLFYPEGKKRIPDTLAALLRDDIALGIWFYDDGYYYPRDKCSYLYLGRVTHHEAETACTAIKRRFNIQTRILDKKNKGFCLYFSNAENEKLKLILEKYRVPVMAYKIPL